MDEESLRWIEWGELGDAQEPMLKIVLGLIDGIEPNRSGTRSRTIDVGAVECPKLLSPSILHGSIVVPTDNFYNE